MLDDFSSPPSSRHIEVIGIKIWKQMELIGGWNEAYLKTFWTGCAGVFLRPGKEMIFELVFGMILLGFLLYFEAWEVRFWMKKKTTCKCEGFLWGLHVKLALSLSLSLSLCWVKQWWGCLVLFDYLACFYWLGVRNEEVGFYSISLLHVEWMVSSFGDFGVSGTVITRQDKC